MIPTPENDKARGQAGKSSNQNSKQANHTGNSAEAQRSRLLDYLRSHCSITTLEARKELDVLHPAMRILELRASGYRIDMVWTQQQTECGKYHRVGKYVLQRGVAA
jgi:hypothetical protein